MVKKDSGHRIDGMRAPVSDILPAPYPCMLAWNSKEAKSYETNAQDVESDMALVLVFSLAAVPAFAADTEAESSTSDTAYGQLHNGLLSEILSQIGIANDDIFIHGIVSDIAAGTLSEDQASAMVDQLAATGKISLTDITTLLGSLTDSGLLDVSTAAQLLYELMTEQAHKQYDRSGNDFSDVPVGQWYTVAVSTLANVGAITGYSNGTFQPRKSISRAEFVTILTGIYGESTSKGMPFSDVGRSWCYDAVATAYANGWVSGYSDGTFRPNQTITSAEAVVILNSVLGCSCDLTYVQANAQAALHFTDITPGAWYYADVIEASMGRTYTELAGIERWTALAAPQKQQTPGTSVPGVFLLLYRRPCMKPSMAVAWMSPPMTRLR